MYKFVLRYVAVTSAPAHPPVDVITNIEPSDTNSQTVDESIEIV